MSTKRVIAASVGAGLLLGGATGVALTLPGGANAQETTTTVPQEAERPGGPKFEILDEMVANGTITQEQADAIRSAAEARHAERGEGRMGEGRMGDGGMRRGGPEGEMRRGPGGPGRGMPLEAAAEAIGLSVEDVRTGLRDGQSLAQIAEANGVGLDELVDRLTADARDRITEMVQRVPGPKPAAEGSATDGSAEPQTS